MKGDGTPVADRETGLSHLAFRCTLLQFVQQHIRISIKTITISINYYFSNIFFVIDLLCVLG